MVATILWSVLSSVVFCGIGLGKGTLLTSYAQLNHITPRSPTPKALRARLNKPPARLSLEGSTSLSRILLSIL